MTNEEIIEHDIELGGSLGYFDLLNLARQDEREKMQQLPNDTGFMRWYEKYFKPLKEPKLWTSKARGQAYGVNDLIAMYNKATQENLKEIATDEREKMQGVEFPLNAGDYVINSKRQLKQICSIEPRENDNVRYNFSDGTFGLKNEKHLGGLEYGNYTKIDVSAVVGSLQGVDCNCLKCSPNVSPNLRFNVCPICGNKRCPHASGHNYECTNSNEPGQCKKFRIVEVLP